MVLGALALAAAAAVATPDAEIKAAAEAMTPALVATRRDLHMHPELSNREERTGKLIAERLKALGLEVRHPVARTGVVGVLRGGRPGPVIGVRADMDGLPIQEKGEAPYKSKNPGVMHACGHDGHMTIGLGTAELLSTFAIEVQGKTVHGATPHKGLDPIPVAAEIVQALQLIVSRQVDAQNPKVLTIGSIHGGNRFNIIADKVTMQGTLRSFDPVVRHDIKERMARAISGVAAANGTTATLRFQGAGNPPTVNDASLARASRGSLERVFGAGNVLETAPQMVAEDFADYAERVPALFLLMGGRNQAKGILAVNHTEDFDIDEAVLPLGVRAMATLVWDYLARARP